MNRKTVATNYSLLAASICLLVLCGAGCRDKAKNAKRTENKEPSQTPAISKAMWDGKDRITLSINHLPDDRGVYLPVVLWESTDKIPKIKDEECSGIKMPGLEWVIPQFGTLLIGPIGLSDAEYSVDPKTKERIWHKPPTWFCQYRYKSRPNYGGIIEISPEEIKALPHECSFKLNYNKWIMTKRVRHTELSEAGGNPVGFVESDREDWEILKIKLQPSRVFLILSPLSKKNIKFPKKPRVTQATKIVKAEGDISAPANKVAVERLVTKNYEVTIIHACACGEGCVSCDNIIYRGVSRKSGKEIILRGSTMHSTAADGVTPSMFQGYKFKNGDITYIVRESGVLLVVKGDSEVLVKEKGTWQY